MRVRSGFLVSRRGLVIGCLVVAVTASWPSWAWAISGNAANRIASRVLIATLRGQRADAYRLRGPLHVGAVIAEPGPGHLQAGRTSLVVGRRASTLFTPLNRRRLRHRVWLYWADLLPNGMFPHPALLLLIDARSGRVASEQTMAWWPIINGRQYVPFDRSARAAANSSTAVSRAGLRIGELVHAPSGARGSAPPGAARGSSPPAGLSLLDAGVAGAAPAPGSRIIEIGDFKAPETGKDFAAWSRFAVTETGLPVIKVNNTTELLAAMRDAYTEGARDVLIYANGHQLAPLAFSVPGLYDRGFDWINRVFTGQGPGPYLSLSSTPGPGHAWKQDVLRARDLQAVIQTAKGRYPGLTVSAVVEACGAGNFGPSLRGVADRFMTSVGPDAFSLGPSKNGQGPSPFSAAVLDAVGKVLGSGGPGTLTGALAKAEPGIAQDTPRRAAQQERADNGSLFYAPSQQPTYDEQGSGNPTPNCGPPGQGGIDLLLMGEFFGQEWAAGEVTATPGDGSQTETASVGYDYVSIGHFGPWRCGTTTTLTATPARGNHFDRWQSGEGLCATPAATCTVPITTTAHQITAYFAPTVYKLSVANDQPDGIVTSGGGGGYVNPGIDCGSQPNGSSVVQVYTSCTSGAIAQRSDSDITRLTVSADNPGPGGDAFGVASIDGCDRSVATTYPIPGGGTYVPSVQCFIDMNSDRAITVSYKDTGKSF